MDPTTFPSPGHRRSVTPPLIIVAPEADNTRGGVQPSRNRDLSTDKLDDFDDGIGQPLRAPAPAKFLDKGFSHQRNADSGRSKTGIDWIVPVGDDKVELKEYTVGERLQPTLDIAIQKRDEYRMKARITGYTLNAAIGLQVLLGSLTTGLSAVATTGKQTAVQTTILGGLATLVASYLARARGSNEPELSITRVKDLEHFIRDCNSFQMDHGHKFGHEHDEELEHLRRQFESLLGSANGERKLSSN